MSHYYTTPYEGYEGQHTSALPAAYALPAERAAFIRRTYAHLAGALLAFIAIEWFLLVPLADFSVQLVALMLVGAGKYSWLIVLGLFLLVGWLAERWALSDASPGLQYLGLAVYTVAEAVIVLPLLFVVTHIVDQPQLIGQAGILSLAVFGGLTACVFTTRKDFSFLGPIVWVAGWLAFGLIVAAILFGFNLGLWFALAMVGLASAAIIYQTSNILHHYRTEQHVAAALGLFASVVTLFYYILIALLKARE
ncbi:MAG: Bax inhibitor-1 family protein [Gemmatales bacterium]|nr:Bax inhibitor-1 family protein [Gemmatales bacterium]MCS7160525.1 Bax inhibitor-1 family protein [Gemmatales bacterium]MDW8175726.1 Bax inhibitor-1 family protein [Gemmatales bacterium]MDW8222445.1 Bax inhibitor-1 family protein [Gemmatales bacterium]